MAKNKFSYKSFVDDVFNDMVKEEKRVIRAAAIHVRKKMRKKVSKKGRSLPGMPPGLNTKNLRKGIKFEIADRDSAFVGLGPPAYHGHLLEFGTMQRRTKKGVAKGRVAARPFVFPTFAEETNAVKRIMLGLSI